MSEATAAIRRAIHDGASRDEFDRIVHAFDRLTPEELPTMLAFAAKHLEAWPEEVRIATSIWWERIARGETVPGFRFVRGLELEDVDRAMALAIGTSAEARQLLRLSLLRVPLGDDGAALLAASERLVTLTSLALIEAELSPAGVRALSQAKWRPLGSLDLSGNALTPETIEPILKLVGDAGSLALARAGLGPEAARKLAASERSERLSALDLSHDDIGDAGAAALSASDWLSHLGSLSLAGNGITARGVWALAQAKWIGNLIALDLSDNELDERIFARASSLMELSLARTGIADAALAEILAHLSLTSLDASGNRAGSASLARMGGIRRLVLRDVHLDPAMIGMIATAERESLDLAGNALTLAALTVIAGSLALEHLDLSRTAIGDAGVALLARGATMSSLVSLRLANDGITPEGLDALLSSERTVRLAAIDLSDNPLGSEGAKQLAESPLLPRLTRIYVRNCGFTPEWIAILRQKNENCRG
jgi:Ran GTPase-activating protein (RanGAP) involved in mRNA processing and transport